MQIRDGAWELMEADPETGRSVWACEIGDEIHIRVDQPVDALLKQNREAFNDSPRDWKGDWHRVASVPLNVLHASGLDDALGQGDQRFVSRWLNDSQNRAFRTRPGRV